MEVVAFNDFKDKSRIIQEIRACGWSGGEFLAYLLQENRLESTLGIGAEVYMLFDGENLTSYCTLSPNDDIPNTEYTPWIGFVFTFPRYRNQGYARLLMARVEDIARNNGNKFVYVSTNRTDLYEHMGYEYFKALKDIYGEPSRVYHKKL